MFNQQNILLIFSICTNVLSGCFSSSSIYKYDFERNDSTFVQRETGAEVFVVMNNNNQSTGELLTVNDSSMFISNVYGLTEEELIHSVNQVRVINNYDIKSMWILGEDNHLIGIAIGAGIGMTLGAVIGYADGDDPPSKGFIDLFNYTAGEKAILGACCLGFAGGLAGLLLGAASSTYDEEIYNYSTPEECDFIQLNLYSRYGGAEPEYLKNLKSF